jgi:hypothetical protein
VRTFLDIPFSSSGLFFGGLFTPPIQFHAEEVIFENV